MRSLLPLDVVVLSFCFEMWTGPARKPASESRCVSVCVCARALSVVCMHMSLCCVHTYVCIYLCTQHTRIYTHIKRERETETLALCMHRQIQTPASIARILIHVYLYFLPLSHARARAHTHTHTHTHIRGSQTPASIARILSTCAMPQSLCLCRCLCLRVHLNTCTPHSYCATTR